MRVVTTCNKEGFDAYGHRLLDGWKHWPREAELHWYTEGFDLPETPGVRAIPMDHLQALSSFKRHHFKYRPPNYLYDVVRFSHKVYAAVDGLSTYNGLGVWLDADCVTYRDIPPDYLRSLLTKDAYIGLFQRAGTYSETGLWIVDCSHPQHQSFMQTWQDFYDSGAFASLGGWTDCHTLDATIRKFTKADFIKVTNLSGEHADNMHPMSKVDLGRYIDHCKGRRKVAGVSPENPHRAAA